jgi:hypothetical protein
MVLFIVVSLFRWRTLVGRSPKRQFASIPKQEGNTDDNNFEEDKQQLFTSIPKQEGNTDDNNFEEEGNEE